MQDPSCYVLYHSDTIHARRCALLRSLIFDFTLVWRDSNGLLYWFGSSRLNPSSIWKGLAVEKSPPRRSAVFCLILEMKRFRRSVCYYCLGICCCTTLTSQSHSCQLHDLKSDWLTLEGLSLTPWSFLPSSFLKELVRCICKKKCWGKQIRHYYGK